MVPRRVPSASHTTGRAGCTEGESIEPSCVNCQLMVLPLFGFRFLDLVLVLMFLPSYRYLFLVVVPVATGCVRSDAGCEIKWMKGTLRVVELRSTQQLNSDVIPAVTAVQWDGPVACDGARQLKFCWGLVVRRRPLSHTPKREKASQLQ